MKKLNELRAERNSLIEKMETVIKLAEAEKRDLSDDEQKTWDTDNSGIENIDKKIETLERQEALNKSKVVIQKVIETPETKIKKRFNLFKAINEAGRGQLTGVEKEIVDEGKKEMSERGIATSGNSVVIPSNLISVRAEIGTGDTTPPIKTGASDILSVVRTPLVLDTIGGIGVTKYEGLNGNFKLPKMGQLSAAFVSEKAAVATSGADLVSDTLAPRRVGATDYFTHELLKQTSPQVQGSIMKEFIDAIWRAVQIDLFDAVAVGATVITGSEITDTPAALTHAKILSMETAIESNFPNMAYAMSNGQKALLKALLLDSGSGRFAWEDNEINGYPAVATDALKTTNGGTTNTAFDVLFGNWTGAVVGSWGGVELIVDPYTASEKGEVKITASGLFDTAIANALSFTAIRNATI